MKKFLKSLILIVFILLTTGFFSCSNDDTSTPASELIEIGNFAEGGIIFYLDETEVHGMVVAMSDQSVSAVWCDNTDEINGADGTAIGTGEQNTQDIVAGCSSSGSAAALCNNLTLNGYSDWHLPSQDELEEIASILSTINEALVSKGGTAISEDTYWSSTELNLGSNTSAVTYDFEFDVSGSLTKFGTARVRAIRSF